MSEVKIQSIHDLLNHFRDSIKNMRDLGTTFEKLTKSYFELDPIYKTRFKKVSLWSDWQYKFGNDNGIDLVAEDFEGQFIAIQCKFYSADHLIKKEDIDSFFTESGKKIKIDGKSVSFVQRIIVSTSDHWSEPAEKSLEQTIPVIRLRVADFDSSPIDWSKFNLKKPLESLKLKAKKTLRPHQEIAINKVLKGLKTDDRGKLIMACGTGKTFTALKFAEEIEKKNRIVLFLVPSISLMSQTLREWTAECSEPFHAFAVCSDVKVGRDSEDISKHDLAIPSTTDATDLIKGFGAIKKDNLLTVIFSTYQSIDVISKAQKKGLPEFDVIICDEAHRTTGVTLVGKDESHFVKVHDQSFIKGKKRLYMTATPKIFGEAVKTKAKQANADLCSMDDEKKFGKEFHRLGFGEAVTQDLLTDYKVLVLAVDERVVSSQFQKQFADKNKEFPVQDIAKIIGCWNGLAKKFTGEEAIVEDSNPMKRAVAFARSIKDSKQIAQFFQDVTSEYAKNTKIKNSLRCELKHVDGTFNVLQRNEKLDWLKQEPSENTCRILTNARCLSEGVDVPALDAVLFLNSRDSIVDVVQSVGRIMRKAEGKKYGYVILPIAIPAGMPPEEALKDNDKYKVVWQVLQALRAHDDRFNATINQIELNKSSVKKISIIGVGGGGSDGASELTPIQMPFPEIEEWKEAIYARIVLKCGSRPYWENWAKDIGEIAKKHTEHIKKLLKTSNDKKVQSTFESFVKSLHKNINPAISKDEAIVMLSQHLITKPIFDALFEHYPFTEKNPVSKSLQSILGILEDGGLKEDNKKLEEFYNSVRLRVRGIDNPEARQKIIVELYDRFFKIAFEKMADRLGIVYTPIEIVDFILNSVNDTLMDEFGQTLSDKDIHILDPFSGTGTFITRLLQSGLIKKEDLYRKFTKELHANEIVLLAYYIAAVNIEETFHSLVAGDYSAFSGIVLTDTFQTTEENIQGEFESSFAINNKRVEEQKNKNISVIVGNPPYSSGQKSANDNNKNLKYPSSDIRIRDTYASDSTVRLPQKFRPLAT